MFGVDRGIHSMARELPERRFHVSEFFIKYKSCDNKFLHKFVLTEAIALSFILKISYLKG